ncbi:hypothetical protein C8Q72DRAFT_560056 [Fomitopsis betulina]|nr:hypothetical protein C8Q72DRAFT_560056 [Fomitopsis betulina]
MPVLLLAQHIDVRTYRPFSLSSLPLSLLCLSSLHLSESMSTGCSTACMLMTSAAARRDSNSDATWHPGDIGASLLSHIPGNVTFTGPPPCLFILLSKKEMLLILAGLRNLPRSLYIGCIVPDNTTYSDNVQIRIFHQFQ